MERARLVQEQKAPPRHSFVRLKTANALVLEETLYVAMREASNHLAGKYTTYSILRQAYKRAPNYARMHNIRPPDPTIAKGITKDRARSAKRPFLAHAHQTPNATSMTNAVLSTALVRCKDGKIWPVVETPKRLSAPAHTAIPASSPANTPKAVHQQPSSGSFTNTRDTVPR